MGWVGANSGLPWEYWRWEIATQTGWSLEYVDALTMADVHEYMQILDGVSKGRASILKR